VRSDHRFLAIDHPWSAELVDQHAKPARPEGFCDRHLNNAAVAEAEKDAFGLGRIVHLNAHAETLGLGNKLGWRIASHQQTITDLQAGVHDSSGRFGVLWNSGLGRGICVTHHHLDFTTEYFFIVLERRLTLTIKAEIRHEIGCHFLSSPVAEQQFGKGSQMIEALASSAGIAIAL
jgi:hypothetical protein